ncbi:MAG TPA: hypothetical protein VGM88_08280 [Kofleriaceae bacterium]|jgi:hypothetical protein
MARDADLAALASDLESLRALMVDPPDGDAVRERYGELVDRYRHEPELLALLRPIGDEIRSREHSGALASTLVARSERKKPKS